MSAALELDPVVQDDPAPSNPKHAPRVISLRWIASALAVLLSASAAVSVAFVSERNARAMLVDEIHNRLVLQARGLAAGSAGALLTSFPELTLQPLVMSLMARQPELAFVVVRDHKNHVQAHPDARLLGSNYRLPDDLVPIRGDRALEPGESLLESDDLVAVRSPVRTPNGRIIGGAFVGLRRAYIEEKLASARRQQAVVLVACLLLSITLSFILMSHLMQPLVTLRKGLQRIGHGDLATPIRLQNRTELGMLAHTVNEMAWDLRHAQAAMIERERLDHEVDIARQIQRSLLPSESRRIGGAYVCGDQKAATEVGGDYYDVLPLADGRVAIAIADVSGKGLPGCLVMAMLSAALRAMRESENSPSQLLVRIDQQLSESLQAGMFVTMFYGILDPRTGQMIWESAGHNPMLVYRAATGQVERHGSRGIPVGALRNGRIRRTVRDHTLQLEPGDVMVHYTDGYTEAVSSATKEQFGLDRIADIVALHGAAGPQVLLEALIESLQTWTGDQAPSDDETLLVVGWQPSEVQAVASGADADSQRGLLALEAAERRGIGRTFATSPQSVATIADWVRALPRFQDLPNNEVHLLGTALFEVCENIAEHGCGHDPSRHFDLWWLPSEGPLPGSGSEAERYVRAGRFVVRDDGRPFRPDGWKPTDFSDGRARSRGRGIGLDIIHRVMRRTENFPGTSRGNITVLAFGPHQLHEPTEREA